MRIVTHFFSHNDQKREFEAITDMPGQIKVQKVVSVSFFLKYISACKKHKWFIKWYFRNCWLKNLAIKLVKSTWAITSKHDFWIIPTTIKTINLEFPRKQTNRPTSRPYVSLVDPTPLHIILLNSSWNLHSNVMKMSRKAIKGSSEQILHLLTLHFHWGGNRGNFKKFQGNSLCVRHNLCVRGVFKTLSNI